jgi:hypothetical protein
MGVPVDEALRPRLAALRSPARVRAQLHSSFVSIASITLLLAVKDWHRLGWLEGLQSAVLMLVASGTMVGFLAWDRARIARAPITYADVERERRRGWTCPNCRAVILRGETACAGCGSSDHLRARVPLLLGLSLLGAVLFIVFFGWLESIRNG